MNFFESVYRFFGWWIINIDILLIVLLLVSGVLYVLKMRKLGRRFLLLGCGGLVFLCVIPIGLWTFENLENRFPKLQDIPPDAKGIILLGGAFDLWTMSGRKETAYNLAVGRFIRFVELAKRYPHLQLAFTGNPLENEMTKKELMVLGLDPSLVLFEGDSKDTKVNAVKSAALLKPKPQDKWVLVTSAYHMPRSVGLFQKAGFNVIPYPVDYHSPGKYEMAFFLGLTMNLQAWQASSREWLGMIINYIMGRSGVICPRPHHQ